MLCWNDAPMIGEDGLPERRLRPVRVFLALLMGGLGGLHAFQRDADGRVGTIGFS